MSSETSRRTNTTGRVADMITSGTPSILPWINDSTRIRIARSMAAFSVMFGASAVLFFVMRGQWNFLIEGFVLNLGLTAVGLGVIAGLVLGTEPRNGAVWTLAWSALFASISVMASAATALLTRDLIPDFGYVAFDDLSPSELPTGAAIAWWIANWTWIPAFFPLLTLGLLLFPDGELPSKRWAWLGWLSVATIATASAGWAWLYWPTSTIKFASTDVDQPVLSVLLNEIYLLLFACWLLCVTSLIRRYRRSLPEARRQIRLIAWGGVIFLIGGLSALVADLSGSNENLEPLLLLAGQMVFVASFAGAILRFRLYDIDLVISKTVTYASLAAFIAAVYVGLVVGVSELIGGRSSFGLSVLSTVVVAIAFQPARRLVQDFANRLVYGNRATPYEVLARFSRRAAESTDEELIDRVPQLIVDGTSAAVATLWVRSSTGFRGAASWPETDETRMFDSEGSRFADPVADSSIPIFHAGELLGGISLLASRGETITRQDEILLADLAAGMGLALRNARLTGELRRQVAELEASRERVLAASDDARRRLENDLDSGPQQQLVALKVKLGPTRMLAERAGAGKTAALLTQLESEAGDAIKAVREFAGGIYPPLLEAEGLKVAIAQQSRSAAVPVDITAEGVGRYSREVEAAVYFSVLEALQNTAKYANAKSASVTLRATDGSLTFEVSDNGRGFDSTVTVAGAGLNGMADRLDTVGGSITIGSTPGEGTIVSGVVPIKSLVVV